MKNNKLPEKNPYGVNKQNAWAWLFISYGLVAVFQNILIAAMIKLFFYTENGLIFGCYAFVLWIIIIGLCIYHGVKDYKDLVKRRLIKTFKTSQLGKKD